VVGAGGSGMSGRALKLPGRLGRAMFAGAEREFLAVDAVRRDAVIVDPAGAPTPLTRTDSMQHDSLRSACQRVKECVAAIKNTLEMHCSRGVPGWLVISARMRQDRREVTDIFVSQKCKQGP